MPSIRKTTPKKTGRPRDPQSKRAIAERLSASLGFKVTEDMVREWEGKGYPIGNVRKLRKELETQQRLPEGMEDTPEAGSLREQILRAELRRKLASADRLEIDAKKVRGELIERAGLAAQAEAVGLATRRMMERLADDLPPQLSGRTAGEIKTILTKRFREALQSIADTPAAQFINDFTNEPAN